MSRKFFLELEKEHEKLNRWTREDGKSCGAPCYVFADKRLTGLDPVDVSGIPRLINGSKYVMFLPLALAKLLSKSAGLLFLDEFLNENRPSMIANAYKIVRDYKIGDIALNEQTLVVAASNSAEHSSISNSIPKPLRDRFDFIKAEPPAVESWVDASSIRNLFLVIFFRVL